MNRVEYLPNGRWLVFAESGLKRSFAVETASEAVQAMKRWLPGWKPTEIWICRPAHKATLVAL